MSIYYGVSQSDHGHEYRWVFEASVIQEKLGSSPGETEDIYFPISGSSASATYFTPLENDIEAVRFLLSAGIMYYEDPELIDIGEYMLTLGSPDTVDDCTEQILDKYGIYDEAIINRDDDGDRHREKVLKMASELKKTGYSGFDSENPFYGMDRNMKFSELEDLHKKVVQRPREKAAKR